MPDLDDLDAVRRGCAADAARGSAAREKPGFEGFVEAELRPTPRGAPRRRTRSYGAFGEEMRSSIVLPPPFGTRRTVFPEPAMR